MEASEYVVFSLAAIRFSRSAQPKPSSQRILSPWATATAIAGTFYCGRRGPGGQDSLGRRLWLGGPRKANRRKREHDVLAGLHFETDQCHRTDDPGESG